MDLYEFEVSLVSKFQDSQKPCLSKQQITKTKTPYPALLLYQESLRLSLNQPVNQRTHCIPFIGLVRAVNCRFLTWIIS